MAAAAAAAAHVECMRARSSHGRPFREAARTPSARFVSRGSSGGVRSRSGTRCQRPAAEVELRAEAESTMTIAPEREHSFDFVSDLIDDAVDDFADDLIMDDDVDVCPSTPAATITPIKIRINDAQLVLNMPEPAISEEVEEDEDICISARMFTARAAEEAISAIAPGSPTLSLKADASSQVFEPRPLIMKQLDLGGAYGEESNDQSSCNDDDYEEVYSLASEHEMQDSDDELEGMAFVKMAVNLAKRAVSKGCQEDAGMESDEAPDEIEDKEAKPVEFLGEGPSCSDELAFDFASNILNSAFEQAAWTWGKQEDKVEEEESLEDLRLLAQTTLTNAAQSGKLESALRNCFQEPALQVSDETEMLRNRVKEALSKGAVGGELLSALKAASEAREMKELKALKLKAREALSKAAAQREIENKATKIEMLREKAKRTLENAAQDGNLVPSLKAALAKKKVAPQIASDILRLEVRQTLAKGVSEGTFEDALRQVIQRREVKQNKKDEEVRVKVRNCLKKGVLNGKLGQLFSAGVEKDLKSKVQDAFKQGVASGKLATTFKEALPAEQKELKKNEQALRNKLQNGFKQCLQAGKLSKLFSAGIQNATWESLRNKVQTTLKESAATTKLQHAFNEALANGQKELVVAECSPSQPVAAAIREPWTPTRSRRRIIGGVVRAPAMQLDMGLPSASPTTSSWSAAFGCDSMRKQSKSSRKAREAPKTFRLDLADVEEPARARTSSLTRGYDTLGAQFNSLCTSGARNQQSAMAMDLGSGEGAASTCSSDLHAAFHFKSSALDQKMRPSASLPALGSQTPRISKARLLPMLPSDKKSPASIASTIHMSKFSSKWGNTGLRHSASMVF